MSEHRFIRARLDTGRFSVTTGLVEEVAKALPGVRKLELAFSATEAILTTTPDLTSDQATTLIDVIASHKAAQRGAVLERTTLARKVPDVTDARRVSAAFAATVSGRKFFARLDDDDVFVEYAAPALTPAEGTALASAVDATRGPRPRAAVVRAAPLPSVTLATLPLASLGGMVLVTDATGGAVLCFSDGRDWRRSTDRTAVD